MTDSQPVRVLVVEDHELLAQSLIVAFGAEGMTAQRAEALTPEHILDAARTLQPHVVLLDLHLDDSGQRTSIPLIDPLRALGASVVMVTGVTDRMRLAECVEAGALGVVSKTAAFEHLVDTVKEVAELRTLLTKHQRDELLSELYRQRAERSQLLAAFEALTPRESEILGALIDGHSADRIAADWVVSVTTVRSQIRSVLSKLGVSSQLGAVAAAHRAGWSHRNASPDAHRL